MVKLSKSIISTILTISASLTAAAQNGTNSYSYLDISSSSHVYGLGGLNISIVDGDINTIDLNPALLGQEMDNEIGLNYMHYIGSSNLAGVRYAKAAGNRGAWSLGIQYLGYGSMKETDEAGAILGSFSPLDAEFSFTYSHDITDKLRGGIDVKYLYSSYAEFTAMAIATDLGINYYDVDRDLSMSLVLANLGGQIKKFNNQHENLPFDIRLGWSKTFGDFPIRFSVTAWNLTKWKLPYYETGDGTTTQDLSLKENFKSNLFRHLIFGADFVNNDNFYIGLGYNYKVRTDMSTYSRSILSGFSLCGGIKVKSFDIGIAFAQPHTGATTFMLNLALGLNELLN